MDDLGVGLLPDKSPGKRSVGEMEIRRPKQVYRQGSVSTTVSPYKRCAPEPADIFSNASPKKRKVSMTGP